MILAATCYIPFQCQQSTLRFGSPRRGSTFLDPSRPVLWEQPAYGDNFYRFFAKAAMNKTA